MYLRKSTENQKIKETIQEFLLFLYYSVRMLRNSKGDQNGLGLEHRCLVCCSNVTERSLKHSKEDVIAGRRKRV